MLPNHCKPWKPADLQSIGLIAHSLIDKQDMYQIASTLSKKYGRTEGAVCKKIEEINKWFWASK